MRGVWKKKIFLYMIVLLLDIYALHETTEVSNLNNMYYALWSYIYIAMIYVPIYLFMLMRRITYFTNPMVITRLKKKKDILILESCENLIQAFEMTIVTNGIAVAFILFELNGTLQGMDMCYLLVCNMLAQSLAWFFFGMIYIMFLNLTEKAVFAFIITVFVVCFLFFSQSATFVFRDYFLDIYAQMVIDTSSLRVNRIVGQIAKSVAESAVLGVITYRIVIGKAIFGNGEKNEAG